MRGTQPPSGLPESESTPVRPTPSSCDVLEDARRFAVGGRGVVIPRARRPQVDVLELDHGNRRLELARSDDERQLHVDQLVGVHQRFLDVGARFHVLVLELHVTGDGLFDEVAVVRRQVGQAEIAVDRGVEITLGDLAVGRVDDAGNESELRRVVIGRESGGLHGHRAVVVPKAVAAMRVFGREIVRFDRFAQGAETVVVLSE